jgi:cytochrome P450
MQAFVYDPSRADFQDRAFEIYRCLRDEHPVYHHSKLGWFAISRYEDVHAAANDREHLSSEGTQGAMGDYPQMQATDPPYHDQLRSLVSAAFTPRRVAAMETRIREITRGLLDRVEESGRFDLHHDFACQVPNGVISDLIGVPLERREGFLSEAAAIVEHQDPEATHHEALLACVGRICIEFEKLLDERRSERCDDLMSDLLDVEMEGRQLTSEEILGFCMLLLTAGTDTVMNLVTSGAVRLAQHPDQRRLLLEDPSRIPLAVEEMLRFDSPAQLLWRKAACDFDLHGVTIPKGADVHLLWGSANHDERIFEDPERFDVTRQSKHRHLAFGIGRHYCLGASLARLEARVMFEELLRRMPEYELECEPKWLISLWARSYGDVPVRFECASAPRR